MATTRGGVGIRRFGAAVAFAVAFHVATALPFLDAAAAGSPQPPTASAAYTILDDDKDDASFHGVDDAVHALRFDGSVPGASFADFNKGTFLQSRGFEVEERGALTVSAWVRIDRHKQHNLIAGSFDRIDGWSLFVDGGEYNETKQRCPEVHWEVASTSPAGIALYSLECLQ